MRNKILYTKIAKGVVSFAAIILILSSILATSLYYNNNITANAARESDYGHIPVIGVAEIQELSYLNEGWYEIRNGFVFYLDTFDSYVPLYIKILNREQQNGLLSIDEYGAMEFGTAVNLLKEKEVVDKDEAAENEITGKVTGFDSISGFAAAPANTRKVTAYIYPSKYDAGIAATEQKYGLPKNLLKAVINVESKFNPNAVGPGVLDKKTGKIVNAKGLGQLMPETQEDYGVRNPFDPNQNIDASGARLRTAIKNANGDVALGLANYNAGEGTVQRAGDIPTNPQTQSFVTQVLFSQGVYNSLNQINYPFTVTFNQPQIITTGMLQNGVQFTNLKVDEIPHQGFQLAGFNFGGLYDSLVLKFAVAPKLPTKVTDTKTNIKIEGEQIGSFGSNRAILDKETGEVVTVDTKNILVSRAFYTQDEINQLQKRLSGEESRDLKFGDIVLYNGAPYEFVSADTNRGAYVIYPVGNPGQTQAVSFLDLNFRGTPTFSYLDTFANNRYLGSSQVYNVDSNGKVTDDKGRTIARLAGDALKQVTDKKIEKIEAVLAEEQTRKGGADLVVYKVREKAPAPKIAEVQIPKLEKIDARGQYGIYKEQGTGKIYVSLEDGFAELKNNKYEGLDGQSYTLLKTGEIVSERQSGDKKIIRYVDEKGVNYDVELQGNNLKFTSASGAELSPENLRYITEQISGSSAKDIVEKIKSIQDNQDLQITESQKAALQAAQASLIESASPAPSSIAPVSSVPTFIVDDWKKQVDQSQPWTEQNLKENFGDYFIDDEGYVWATDIAGAFIIAKADQNLLQKYKEKNVQVDLQGNIRLLEEAETVAPVTVAHPPTSEGPAEEEGPSLPPRPEARDKLLEELRGKGATSEQIAVLRLHMTEGEQAEITSDGNIIRTIVSSGGEQTSALSIYNTKGENIAFIAPEGDIFENTGKTSKEEIRGILSKAESIVPEKIKRVLAGQPAAPASAASPAAKPEATASTSESIIEGEFQRKAGQAAKPPEETAPAELLPPPIQEHPIGIALNVPVQDNQEDYDQSTIAASKSIGTFKVGSKEYRFEGNNIDDLKLVEIRKPIGLGWFGYFNKDIQAEEAREILAGYASEKETPKSQDTEQETVKAPAPIAPATPKEESEFKWYNPSTWKLFKKEQEPSEPEPKPQTLPAEKPPILSRQDIEIKVKGLENQYEEKRRQGADRSELIPLEIEINRLKNTAPPSEKYVKIAEAAGINFNELKKRFGVDQVTVQDINDELLYNKPLKQGYEYRVNDETKELQIYAVGAKAPVSDFAVPNLFKETKAEPEPAIPPGLSDEESRRFAREKGLIAQADVGGAQVDVGGVTSRCPSGAIGTRCLPTPSAPIAAQKPKEESVQLYTAGGTFNFYLGPNGEVIGARTLGEFKDYKYDPSRKKLIIGNRELDVVESQNTLTRVNVPGGSIILNLGTEITRRETQGNLEIMVTNTGDIIIIDPGLTKTFAYNEKTGSWTTLSSLPGGSSPKTEAGLKADIPNHVKAAERGQQIALEQSALTANALNIIGGMYDSNRNKDGLGLVRSELNKKPNEQTLERLLLFGIGFSDREKDYGLMKNYAEMLISLKPSDSVALNSMAWAEFKNAKNPEDLEKAEKFATRSVNIKKTPHNVHTLASIYEEQSKRGEPAKEQLARNLFLEAYAADSKDPKKLADYYRTSKESDEGGIEVSKVEDEKGNTITTFADGSRIVLKPNGDVEIKDKDDKIVASAEGKDKPAPAGVSDVGAQPKQFQPGTILEGGGTNQRGGEDIRINPDGTATGLDTQSIYVLKGNEWVVKAHGAIIVPQTGRTIPYDSPLVINSLWSLGFGYYDSTTKSIIIQKQDVMAFQKRYGLAQDGVVGPLTVAKINEVLESERKLQEPAQIVQEQAPTAPVGAPQPAQKPISFTDDYMDWCISNLECNAPNQNILQEKFLEQYRKETGRELITKKVEYITNDLNYEIVALINGKEAEPIVPTYTPPATDEKEFKYHLSQIYRQDGQLYLVKPDSKDAIKVEFKNDAYQWRDPKIQADYRFKDNKVLEVFDPESGKWMISYFDPNFNKAIGGVTKTEVSPPATATPPTTGTTQPLSETVKNIASETINKRAQDLARKANRESPAQEDIENAKQNYLSSLQGSSANVEALTNFVQTEYKYAVSAAPAPEPTPSPPAPATTPPAPKPATLEPTKLVKTQDFGQYEVYKDESTKKDYIDLGLGEYAELKTGTKPATFSYQGIDEKTYILTENGQIYNEQIIDDRRTIRYVDQKGVNYDVEIVGKEAKFVSVGGNELSAEDLSYIAKEFSGTDFGNVVTQIKGITGINDLQLVANQQGALAEPAPASITSLIPPPIAFGKIIIDPNQKATQGVIPGGPSVPPAGESKGQQLPPSVTGQQPLRNNLVKFPDSTFLVHVYQDQNPNFVSVVQFKAEGKEGIPLKSYILHKSQLDKINFAQWNGDPRAIPLDGGGIRRDAKCINNLCSFTDDMQAKGKPKQEIETKITLGENGKELEKRIIDTTFDPKGTIKKEIFFDSVSKVTSTIITANNKQTITFEKNGKKIEVSPEVYGAIKSSARDDNVISYFFGEAANQGMAKLDKIQTKEDGAKYVGDLKGRHIILLDSTKIAAKQGDTLLGFIDRQKGLSATIEGPATADSNGYKLLPGGTAFVEQRSFDGSLQSKRVEQQTKDAFVKVEYKEEKGQKVTYFGAKAYVNEKEYTITPVSDRTNELYGYLMLEPKEGGETLYISTGEPNTWNPFGGGNVYKKGADGKLVKVDDKDAIAVKNAMDKERQNRNLPTFAQVSSQRFFANVDRVLTEFQGLGYYSTLFFDEDSLLKWRDNVDRAFATFYLGTEYWSSAICGQYLDGEDDGIAYAETPQGLAQVAAHIEATRTEPILTPTGEEFIYKITFNVRNGDYDKDPRAPEEMHVNVILRGDKTVTLFKQEQKVKRGSSFGRIGRNAIVQDSTAFYNEICLTFDKTPLRWKVSNNEVCNTIVESSGTPTTVAATASAASSQGSGAVDGDINDF